jgi:hypothetical protein
MRRRSTLAVLAVALVATQVAGAAGRFVEPVRVLYTIRGSTPPKNCNTACFGETVYVIAGDEEDR